jgi:hypothetical protein
MIIKVSSTYWITGKSVEDERRMGRFSNPKLFALLRMDWIKSAARTKRRGERGSPCLTPFCSG